MSWLDIVGQFVSGLKNYNYVPPRPDPVGGDVPPPPESPTPAPSAATAAQGWRKSLDDCHERLRTAYPLVVAEFATLYPECSLQLDYTWRSPAFQFELFKRGRAMVNGKWIVTNKALVVTEKDGTKPSHHNVYPAQGLDMYVRRDGQVLWPDGGAAATGHNELYAALGKIWERHGLVSGATWRYTWKDWDHVQVDYPII